MEGATRCIAGGDRIYGDQLWTWGLAHLGEAASRPSAGSTPERREYPRFKKRIAMTETSDDELLSRAAAARYLGVGDRTLRRLIDDGVLAPELCRRDLDAYLATVRVAPGSLAHLCMWDR